MKNIKMSLVLLTLMSFLKACGQKVEVPPANVGKILGKNGYMPDTIPPSKFRLAPCWAYCDKLVKLQVSDNQLEEPLKVFMPKDKLNITVDIRGTFSIPNDQKTVDAIFNKVVAEEYKEGSWITAKQVYDVYGRQAVRGIVRSEITKYTIQEVLANRESIGQNIHAAISAKLKTTNTPLSISRFELADVQPPKVIVEAQEAAKEREIDIQKAEASAQVALVEAEKALEIAKANRLVEREKASAIAEQNKIASASITPQVLAYKQLETALAIVEAAAKNGNTVFLPIPTDANSTGTLTDSAVLAKMLGKEARK